MDLSSNRSQDEDKIMQRQLYRPGQPQPAPKAPASAPARSAAPKGPSSPPAGAAKPKVKKAGEREERILLMILMLGIGYFLVYGTPSQRKKTFIGLGVVGWLLLLGTISYCLCLPNLEELNRERKAIFEDQNLSMKEKFEKIRDLEKGLTSSQRRDLRKLDMKERIRKNNRDVYDFLKMTPEEQMAQLRKEDAERRQFMEKMRKEWGNRPKNKNNNNKGNNNKGNNNNNNNRNGPPGGGFGGGGGANRDISMLESGSSPEARAGNAYKRGMAQQAGLGGGFGGPGGRGGPGGGGGGGRGGGGR